MTDKFSLEEICQFWTQQALEHGQSPAASWSDSMIIQMEIQEITRRLADGDHILDIGCGNGYSTVQFASQKRVTIRALDYIPEMVEQACQRLAGLPTAIPGKIKFEVGDISALNEPAEAYDKVVAIRVLINLPEWNRQLKAFRECARALKSGGTLLLSEATLQGWQRLNNFRQEWGLPDIPMPPFNLYLDEEQMIEAASPDLQFVEIANFASTYYVGTRILKPLLSQALGMRVNAADPHMEWNRWFSQLPSWGDYGTQKLFVFRKK